MFIVNTSCISPQLSYDLRLFTLGQVEHLLGNQYKALEPPYKKLIPLNLLRRMDKAVRMGIGAGMTLIKQAEKEKQAIEGIIIGSANGSIDKSMKFLHQMVDYEEGTLTPSDFIQSTSNSIAGTLALLGKVQGYNNTHVNGGLAFESAVLDAFLQFETTEIDRLILGGVDELSQSNFNIDDKRGMFKQAEQTHSENLLRSNSHGTVAGEGAALFTLEREYSTNAKARIVDVDQFVFPSFDELTKRTESFLAKNGMAPHDIDVLFMGYNGDTRMDAFYEHFRRSLFEKTGIYTFKNLVGEYYTASSFAMWMAANLLGGQTMPRRSIWTAVPRRAKKVLIYNHYEGNQHGLILLKRPW
ncbi:MAG: beta-ketoacyl synthase chain length factor [Aureispira sp.]